MRRKRGALTNPASFLKRKRERRIGRKRCFRQGIIDFLGSALRLVGGYEIPAEVHFCLVREYEIPAEMYFRLAGQKRGFCESVPLSKKSGFKLKLHLSKTLLIPHQKFLGFLSPFFKKDLNGVWGNAP